MKWWVVFLVLLGAAACHAEERTVEADVPQRVDDLQSLSSSLVPINDFVYKVEGEGAIFLINTDEGSVLVDTGFAGRMADQQALIREAATGPIRKIILTHSHIDHSGGITAWQPDLDAGATGSMTSGLIPDLIRPVITAHTAGDRDAAVAGYARVVGNFSQVVVRAAGHIVPGDQPERATRTSRLAAQRVPD